MNPVFRQRKECTVPSGTAIPGRCVERTEQAPLFRLPVPKIHLIYSPRVEDVSDIKLIRTDFFFRKKFIVTRRYISRFTFVFLYIAFFTYSLLFTTGFFPFPCHTFFTVLVFTPFETSFF